MAAAGVYAEQRREEARRLKAGAVLRRSASAGPGARAPDENLGAPAVSGASSASRSAAAGVDTRELKKMMSGRFVCRSASVDFSDRPGSAAAGAAPVAPSSQARRTTPPDEVPEDRPSSRGRRPHSSTDASPPPGASRFPDSGRDRRKEGACARQLRGIAVGSRPSPPQPSASQVLRGNAARQAPPGNEDGASPAPEERRSSDGTTGEEDDVARRMRLRAQLRGTRLASPSQDTGNPETKSRGGTAPPTAQQQQDPRRSSVPERATAAAQSPSPSTAAAPPPVKVPPTSTTRPRSAQSDKQVSPTATAPMKKQARVEDQGPGFTGREEPSSRPWSPKTPPQQQQAECAPLDAGGEVHAIRQARKKLSKEAFVEYIYAHHPPKDASRRLNQRLPIQKQMQKALSHYHPDKQNAAKHGAAWCLICEEIYKEITRMY